MASSQNARPWLVGGGLAAFVLILVGYVFFIGPQRSETSDVGSRTDTAQTQNLGLQTRLQALRAENAHLSKYRTELAAAQRALPSTSGVSDFLRTLQSLGNSTQTSIAQMTVGAPTDVSSVAAGPGAAGAGTTPSSSASSPSPSAAPSASASASAAPANGASSAPSGPQTFGLPITAQVSGSPAALNRFLEQLQAVQPRAVLITAITETTAGAATGGGPAPAGAGSTMLQLTMQAFVAPASPVEQAQLSGAAH